MPHLDRRLPPTVRTKSSGDVGPQPDLYKACMDSVDRTKMAKPPFNGPLDANLEKKMRMVMTGAVPGPPVPQPHCPQPHHPVPHVPKPHVPPKPNPWGFGRNQRPSQGGIFVPPNMATNVM